MMQVQLEGMDGFGLNKSSQLCYQWANVEGEHWNFYIKVKSLPLELLLFNLKCRKHLSLRRLVEKLYSPKPLKPIFACVMRVTLR